MSNKIRALLTMLGIIIGVGAVVGMLSIGNGLTAFFEREFEKLGIGVFYITPGVDTTEIETTQAPRLTAADARAILAPGAAPAVRNVSIEYETNAVVSAGRDRYFYPIQSVTPSYFRISDNELLAGRYYTEAEENARQRVAVVGRDVAEALYGDPQSAIGQRIVISGVTFDVIGVLNTEASQISGSFVQPTEMVYIPYETGRTRIFRNQINARVDVGRISVQAVDRTQVDAAIEQVTQLLRERHRLTTEPNGFRINNPEREAEQARVSIIALNGFLSIIAGISLLVGGIGIMNIMLVSVTQRTREIGLRKAVGARRWDIMQQFLIEAVVLCLIGCLLGVVLGYVMSFIGTFVLQSVFLAEEAESVVTLSSVVLATVVSTLIGVGFGFFPALRASRLNPIQALRTE